MLDVVELSRLQFALTAMYHFLFVPLTLGMGMLIKSSRDSMQALQEEKSSL